MGGSSELAASWTSVDVELPAGTINVLRGGQGPDLVVLHRDTGRHGWTEFHERLASDHTVYAPAMPGFDGSDAPHWLRSVQDLSLMLGLALDRLGLDAPLAVGLGFGSYVLAELVIQNPRRMNRVVVVSPMGVRPSDEEFVVDQFLFSSSDYLTMGFERAEKCVALFGDDEGTLFDLLEPNREAATRVAWKPYMWHPHVEPLLRSIDVTACALWPATDRIVPIEYARRTADAWGCSLEVLPEGGHQVDLEVPELLAGAVRSFAAAATNRGG
jgi:pimeloyl-ACP methyl ester carboxylesterase